MVAKRKSEAEKVQPPGDSKVTVDLRRIYEFDAKDIVTDIDTTKYSNLAYIQVTPRDLYIDFLAMPGVKKDGRMVVSGVRVYMSHVAGQRLSEALGRTISEVAEKGRVEELKKR
jgi:hypothetical protein